MVRVNSWANGVRRTYERGATRFESGVELLEQRYTPLGRFTPGPFEGWSFLWQPALLGFAVSPFLLGCAAGIAVALIFFLRMRIVTEAQKERTQEIMRVRIRRIDLHHVLHIVDCQLWIARIQMRQSQGIPNARVGWVHRARLL